MNTPSPSPGRNSDTWGRTLLDNPYLIAISTDGTGTIREINRGALLLLGYERDELVGRTNLVRLHDPVELRERARELTEELGRAIEPSFEALVAKADDDAPPQQEWCYLRKDGSKLPLLLSIMALTSHSGGVAGYLSLGEDPRRRKQIKADLRRSEERFSHIFHESPMGIVISTLEEGRVLDINESALRSVGCTREQVVGRPAASLNMWPTIEERREVEEALLATGRYRNWRKRFRHPSGELRTVFVSMRLLELQEERCILTMTQDVTDHEHMERELGRQRQFLEVLLENLREGIVACDETGALSLFNRVSRALHRETPLGLPFEHWSEHHPLYQPNGATRLRPDELPLRRAFQGEVVKDVDVVVVPGEGKPRRLEVNAQPLFSEAGDKLGAVALFRDVTEQKAYERELERSVAFRETLVRIVNEFLAVGPGDRSYARLLEHGVRMVPGAQGGSVLIRGADGFFRFGAAEGYDLEALTTLRFAEHELIRPPEGAKVGIIHHLVQHNREALEVGRRETMITEGRTPDIRASLTIPVSVAGKLAAVLLFDNFDREDAFGGEAISMAKTLAAQLGVLAQRFALERELEERGSRLAEAQRIAGLGSWEWDITTDMMICSETQPALFGLTKNSFPSTIEGFLQRVHPEDRERAREAIEHAQRDAEPFTFGYRTVAPVGEERFHFVRGEVVTDELGKPQRLVGTTQDVTEQKRAEQALVRNAEALQRRHWEMRTLNQMMEMLQACRDPSEAYEVAEQFGPGLLQAKAGVLYVRNGTSTTMARKISWGDATSAATITDHECRAMRDHHTHIVNSAREGVSCKHIRERASASHLCLPLTAHELSLGVLHLEGNTFSEHEIELTRTFADQFALALANLQLRDSLREQSIRDPLTELFNRRYFSETLERELARAEREKSSVALVFLDVDYFKTFNDDYGHEAGDLVLQRMAHLLQAQSRMEDVACRYGGEEFALLMPGADVEVASRRAENLRRKAEGITVDYQGRTLPRVTLSLGVAAFPQHAASGGELVRRADGALYRAKNEGRNRVAVVDDPVA